MIGAIIGNAAHAVAIQYIIYVIVAIVTISLSVRRLHDSGKSGFWWLIGFIPVIGTITLIVFYCLPGRLGRLSTTHSVTVSTPMVICGSSRRSLENPLSRNPSPSLDAFTIFIRDAPNIRSIASAPSMMTGRICSDGTSLSGLLASMGTHGPES